MATVFNNEFRDRAAQSAFPFTSDSLMAYEDVVIDAACFLDASIYPLEAHTAPFYISSLSLSTDINTSLKVSISDANNMLVGTVHCSTDTIDSAIIQDKYESVIGVLVYTPNKIKDLIGALERTSLSLPENILRFTAGTCFASEFSGNRMFVAKGNKYQDNIVITAAGGVHFAPVETSPPYNSSSSSSSSQSSQSSSSQSSHSSSSSEAPYSTVSSSSSSESSHSSLSSASSSSFSSSSSVSNSNSSSSSESSHSSSSSSPSSASSGSSSSFSSSSSWDLRNATISVNLYGEMYTLDAPIKSINGRLMDNVWLSAHPDSAIRVVTSSDEKIIIGKAKEFN